MSELDPVGAGEFVYRRIHMCYFRSDSPIAILRGAFHPTDSDNSGISVFRAHFVSPIDLIPPDKMNLYYVARLSMRALRQLGLSVTPDPTGGGPLGHAVVPELAWQAYQSDKAKWRPVLVKLAVLASADIVLRPRDE